MRRTLWTSLIAFAAMAAPACGDDDVRDADAAMDGGDADGGTVVPECGDGVVEGDEECDDGNVEDGDGCDSSCREESTGPEEVCDSGEDEDGDGDVDCMDTDCDADPACPETCDGTDEDGDGRIDESPMDPTIGDPCYDGPDGVAGVGECAEGAITCFGGALTCEGWVAPEEELCDGLDNDCDGEVPSEEAAMGCSTDITTGSVSRIEFRSDVRDVDVHINLDTTGSMGGELDTLRTTLSSTIVPAIREALPTSEFGVSTFDDFPVGGFGDAEDLPFFLHQRVTSNVPRVQSALDAIPLHSGSDGPEAGIESLFQIATGDGTSWPREAGSGGVATPGARQLTVGAIETDGDGDAYTVSLAAGDTLVVDIDAEAAGSDLDSYLRIYDQAGDGTTELASNDDDDGYDSRVEYTATDAVDVVIEVRSCCSLPGSGTGWYAMHVTVNGDELVADADDCSGLEVGDSGFVDGVFTASETVPLVDPSSVYPRADAAACTSDCEGVVGTTAPEWIAAWCTESTGECGDGTVDPGEECDDGNTDPGDGCDATCRSEVGRVPEMRCMEGFDSGLGHGTIGGVCFRSSALPVVVHITDAVSHEAADYTAYDATIDAHDADQAFMALNDIGARVVAVRSGAASSDPTDRRYPLGMALATDSVVPLCAFDGSDARTSGACAADQCCTGIDGAGVPPQDGECPLVFQISGSGTGLDTSIVGALDALTQFVRYSISAEAEDDTSDAIDATCFVQSIGIVGFSGPSGSCAVTPMADDTDGDGVDDTLLDATPRTRVTFEVAAINQDINDVDGDGDTDEPCADPGTYPITMNILADDTTLVARRTLSVIVPE